MIQRYFFLLVVCLALGMMSSNAYAQEKATTEKPWKRFSLKLGPGLGVSDTSVRLGTKGLSLNLNLEDFFGVDRSTSTFRIDGFWRFAPRRRHRLDFTWFSYRRSGFNGIPQDVEIGGITIPAGTGVETRFDVDVYRVGYSYSFIQDKRLDLAVATGVYVIPIRLEIDTKAVVDRFVSESITAPLPLIGLRADVAITRKWFLRSSFDWFYLVLGDFRGAVFDTNIALEYNAFKHVGFGVGVENINMLVEAENDVWPGVDFKGQFELNALQATAYLKVYFGK